ncbi:hypothetical protein [Burkholderia stagnalis]|uniref:hypothetical protein n=1 Tax=Burkholderia stagnalis TaxID=1503054 RepID=UPI000F5AF766|nr:hypothetical protein [Burkholderia stagnalis]
MEFRIPPLWRYESPPTDLLRVHAGMLYARRDEAIDVAYVEVSGAGWRPAVQDCHGNCETWCGLHPEYRLVRGWIFIPLPGLAYSRFLPHSIVRQPDGQLVDITPRGHLLGSTPYRFLGSIVDNEVYEAMVVDLYAAAGTGNLDWQHSPA